MKLEPCPFCGIKPLSCAEGIKHRRTTKNLWCPLGENEDALYDLVDWNTRPGERAARVKALRQVLSQVQYESEAIIKHKLERAELDSIDFIKGLIEDGAERITA